MQTETRDCRHGRMIYLPNDVFIGRALQTYGEWAEGEVAIFRQLLKPGHFAVDAGANIGVLTLGMATLVGPQGRVHAFEPQVVLHDLLCRNVALNGHANVVAHRMAAGAAAGTRHVPPLDYDRPGNFGGVQLGGEEGDAVPVATVDGLELPRLDLIKADVEGMELDVIKGARESIARFQPAIYVENDRREKSQALIAAILDLGYRLWWHITPLFNPDNFFGHREDVFGNRVSCNMLGLPPTAARRVALPEITSPLDTAVEPDGSIRITRR
jgi:FkbM family methyltransferase